MAQIKGIEGMTNEQINEELMRGGKFIVFKYCISIIIMTFNRKSDIHFIKNGESAFPKSIGYTILTFILGWWGFPWGPIYTIGALFTNLGGGQDVTKEILSSIAASTNTGVTAQSLTNISSILPDEK